MRKDVEITIDTEAARIMLNVAGFSKVYAMSDDEVFEKILDRIETYGAKAVIKDFGPYKEYESLENQGLLIKLPCPEGTEVWVIYESLIYGEVGDKADVYYHIERRKFTLDMLHDYGKTVFLTKEEAEIQLKIVKKSK